ncbi:hypothetical protein C8F01DRAFT_1188645 [Mycena amicta]|nr:hypothetical protein C8F01DRAFT_1188645 [Mycena amicta]
MAGDDDVKPDVGKLQLIVQFNDQSLTFLYSKTKPLEKLLLKFCERLNLDRTHIKFVYNGANVRGDEVTAENMGMDQEEDGELPVIEGHMFQEGGEGA